MYNATFMKIFIKVSSVKETTVSKIYKSTEDM